MLPLVSCQLARLQLPRVAPPRGGSGGTRPPALPVPSPGPVSQPPEWPEECGWAGAARWCTGGCGCLGPASRQRLARHGGRFDLLVGARPRRWTASRRSRAEVTSESAWRNLARLHVDGNGDAFCASSLVRGIANALSSSMWCHRVNTGNRSRGSLYGITLVLTLVTPHGATPFLKAMSDIP